jgi:xanthine dehydrogenase accessory factor
MDSVDLTVLRTAIEWQQSSVIWLVTVVKTYGSSPRPVGSMLLIKSDGSFIGSVSGGCIEDDLTDKARSGQLASDQITRLTYGGTREDDMRFGLPCGGTLDLVIEPIKDSRWLKESLHLIEQHLIVERVVHFDSLAIQVSEATPNSQFNLEEDQLTTVFGPTWRLLIIGAGQTSTYLAQIATGLNFDVIVCDPRVEFSSQWNVPNTKIVTDMPDDVILNQQVDSRTAVVAVTHDPKLDDMALLEALKSPAFYVGALGSQRNSDKRRERLAMFDLTPEEIAKLHGPIGIDIRSKTPPEIAISILAHIISVKNQQAVLAGSKLEM